MDAQILHAHDGRGQTLGWLASLGLPVRRVASRRVTFFPSDRWTYRLKYGRTCDAVIAVSENIRELSVRAGVPRERIAVIPDGIDVPAELPSPSERLRLRKLWRCDNDDFVVGLLGAPTAEKGQDVALAAMAMLKEKLPRARMVFAGDEANLLGTGAIPGVDKGHCLLPSAPSKTSQISSPASTSSSCLRSRGIGVFRIVGDGLRVSRDRHPVGGLAEIVAENQTGWLVPPGSPQALADMIVLASRDHARLTEFGQTAASAPRRFLLI